MLRWLRSMVRAGGDARGIALVTVAFVLFAVGMMLFGFVFINQNEASFAGVYRSNTMALGLAEAGIQEAIDRLNTYGRQANGGGVSSFPNSLAASAASPWSTGTVYFEQSLLSSPEIFPIRSSATFLGQKRTVRIFEQVMTKTGTGNIIFGPQMTFSGNAHDITGDGYSRTAIQFQQFQKSPPCAAGATATNLVGQQIMAGTAIGAGAGPAMASPCGGPTNVNAAPYNTGECVADPNFSELPPTGCTTTGGRQANLPFNWHPGTPQGMDQNDFNFIINAPNGQLPLGVAVTPATQNGVAVTYTPASYTPPYWSLEPATNGRVMLVTAAAEFCVNRSVGLPVGLTNPAIPGQPCPLGYNKYGNYNASIPPGVVGNNQTRYIDWGLVQDDLNKTVPQTFFQAPGCTAPCANPGNQNGIRYIPAPPSINVLNKACLQNFNPGHTVFDPVNQPAAVACPSPPTTTIAGGSTAVTFDGTFTNPEALIIDNAGGAMVTISPSIPGPGSCSSNFQNYNVGIILATGDLSFAANIVFSGYIYTPGSINSAGTVVFQGGIFSATVNPGQSHLDSTGTVSLCAGSAAALPETSSFFTFKVISWDDLGAQ